MRNASRLPSWGVLRYNESWPVLSAGFSHKCLLLLMWKQRLGYRHVFIYISNFLLRVITSDSEWVTLTSVTVDAWLKRASDWKKIRALVHRDVWRRSALNWYFKKVNLGWNVPVLNLWIQHKNCLLDKFTVLQYCSEPETDPCWSI